MLFPLKDLQNILLKINKNPSPWISSSSVDCIITKNTPEILTIQFILHNLIISLSKNHIILIQNNNDVIISYTLTDEDIFQLSTIGIFVNNSIMKEIEFLYTNIIRK